jgi:hypothetical protein
MNIRCEHAAWWSWHHRVVWGWVSLNIHLQTAACWHAGLLFEFY